MWWSHKKGRRKLLHNVTEIYRDIKKFGSLGKIANNNKREGLDENKCTDLKILFFFFFFLIIFSTEFQRVEKLVLSLELV